MKIDVKICGVTQPDHIEACVAAGVDYIGFMLVERSKRYVSIDQAARLAGPARGLTSIVAVTVNADDAFLQQIMDQIQPDYIQCHGEESVDRVAQIARKFKVKIIKAVPVSTDDDIIKAETYSGVADIILYDAKPPKGSDIRGGHGLRFDWKLLTRAPLPKYWALAGGLNFDTVGDALALTQAPLLDVSSGVESVPGVKSTEKIKAFMKAVKGTSCNG